MLSAVLLMAHWAAAVARSALWLVFPKFVVRFVCRAWSVALYELLHFANWALSTAFVLAEGTLGVAVPGWVRSVTCRRRRDVPLGPMHTARGQQVPNYSLGVRAWWESAFAAAVAAGWRIVEAVAPGPVRRWAAARRPAPPCRAAKATVFAFEGIPYATVPKRFECPLEVAYTAATPGRAVGKAGESGAVVNPPRAFDWGYTWGSSQCVAPQACRMSMDSPMAVHAAMACTRYLRHGYAGDEAGCLQLNVWASEAALADAAAGRRGRAVVVFIHGGAYIFSSGSARLTSGVEWAKRDVVFVTVNYRLGALGWLRVPGKASNLGLRDCLAALRWVQRHIAAFGGDPANVTMAGQSAGAMTVTHLLGTAEVYEERLAAKVMAMSGAPHHIFSQKDAEDAYRYFLAAAGKDGLSEAAAVRWLETAPMGELVQATDRFLGQELRRNRTNQSKRILPLSPWIEKDAGGPAPPLLPRHPINAVRKRKAAGQPLLPLLIGTTESEFTFFSVTMPLRHRKMQTCPKALSTRVMAWLQHKTGGAEAPSPGRAAAAWAAQAEKIVREYCDAASPRRYLSPYGVWDAVHTDWVFRAPAQHLATLLVADSLAAHDAPNGATKALGDGELGGGSAHTLTTTSGEDLLADEYFLPVSPLSPALDCPAPSTPSASCCTSTPSPPALQPAVSTAPAFMYRFDHRAMGGVISSAHIVDLHYFFGTHDVAPYFSGGYSRKDARVSRAIMDDVQRFFTTPDTRADLCDGALWRPWDAARRPVKRYGVRQEPSTRLGRCVAWVLGLTGAPSQRRTCRSSEAARVPAVHVENEGDDAELVSWGDSFDQMPHRLDEETQAC
eukprot:TRINITY_DN2658_c0_g2_i1.p1 TRINITY_DN2658_c0_g2~~TRINITY_DN2658_c0_g2_i1.p1  ORF type:complete len:839 (+),score=260.34 TRINITY_DN2658_c0_g2_i1:67-2583(+)